MPAIYPIGPALCRLNSGIAPQLRHVACAGSRSRAGRMTAAICAEEDKTNLRSSTDSKWPVLLPALSAFKCPKLILKKRFEQVLLCLIWERPSKWDNSDRLPWTVPWPKLIHHVRLGVSSWWRHQLGFIFLVGGRSSYCLPQRSDDSIEHGRLMVLVSFKFWPLLTCYHAINLTAAPKMMTQRDASLLMQYAH